TDAKRESEGGDEREPRALDERSEPIADIAQDRIHGEPRGRGVRERESTGARTAAGGTRFRDVTRRGNARVVHPRGCAVRHRRGRLPAALDGDMLAGRRCEPEDSPCRKCFDTPYPS